MDFRGLKATLISRITCALAYSAYDLIRTSVPHTMLVGLVPLFACGAVFCKRVEGLKILFAILAAQGLTSLMPIPNETTASVVMPNVMMYFAVFSIVRTQLLINDDLSDQFMALSLNARAFAYFKTTEQITEAALVSIAYIVIATAAVEGTTKTVIDCFATRSAAMWVASFFELEPLMILLLILSHHAQHDMLPHGARFSSITSIMELKCAQQLIGRAATDGAAMIALLVILLFFTRRLGGVSTCGLSILATKRLECWIKEWNETEAALVYMSAFCILQACKNYYNQEVDRDHIVIIAHEEADDYLRMMQM